MESIATATDRAIEAATHLTVMDQGAVETLRFLAKKIDTEETLRDMALEWAAEDEKRRPPSVDNVYDPDLPEVLRVTGAHAGWSGPAGHQEGADWWQPRQAPFDQGR